MAEEQTIEETKEDGQEQPQASEDVVEDSSPDAGTLGPTGIMILIIAFGFDVLGWVSAVLIAAFGVGVLLGQIVNVFGFLTIASLLKMYNKEKAEGLVQDKVWDIIKTLFKKNKINSIAEVLPGVGDVWPGFTIMAYKGLS